MAYLPRIVDEELSRRLASTGGVVIEGPKACGKTETARQVAASEVRLDVDENARRAIDVDPSLVLEGATPRLIDEWQVEPRIWNHVRRQIDDRKSPGQFILTGSAVPADDVTRHTGAGRLTRLQMRPMSLFESGVSNGNISLRSILDGNPAEAVDSGLDARTLADRIVSGGWPALHGLSADSARQGVRDYLEEIRRFDLNAFDGKRRDPEKVGSLLRSLARNTGTYAAATTLARDAGGSEGPLIDDTVREYLDLLSRLMVTEDQTAWAPHLRSKAVLRKSPKRHFVDPSIATAALNAGPEKLMMDLKFFGFLFESLAVRDLRIYGQTLGARIYQYRDSKGLEVDAITELDDGRWAAFEIKLGPGKIDEGAETLKKFSASIDKDSCGEPATLGVIVGSGYGYTREDGIAVIPVGALGP